MKFLFTLLSFFLTINLIAQNNQSKRIDSIPMNSTTGKVTLTKVAEIPNTSKEEIYRRLYDWYRITVSNPNPYSLYKKSDSASKYYIQTIQDLSNWGLLPDSAMKPKERAIYQLWVSNYFENQKWFGNNYEIGQDRATLSVFIKDNKVKVELSDFIHYTGTPQALTRAKHDGAYPFEEVRNKAFGAEEWKSFRLKMLIRFQGLINDIVKNLGNKSDMDF